MSFNLNKMVSHFDGDYVVSNNLVSLANQTGAAVTRGAVAVINLNLANGSYAGLTDVTAASYLFANAVAVTTDNQHSWAVVATESIASGARGKWQLCTTGTIGYAFVDASCTAGMLLTPTNAANFFTGFAGTQAGIDALLVPRLIVGRALQAFISTTAPVLCAYGFTGVICGEDGA